MSINLNGNQVGSSRSSAWSFAKMEEKEKGKEVQNLREEICFNRKILSSLQKVSFALIMHS